MSNKTLICVLQLWSICSTVIAMTFKRSQLELTINLDKKIYYGNRNMVPFLQLKKSLTSLCALTSLLQLRSTFVYEALKKQYHVKSFCILLLSTFPTKLQPSWGGDNIPRIGSFELSSCYCVTQLWNQGLSGRAKKNSHTQPLTT